MVTKEGKGPQNQPPRGFQFKSGHPEAPSESRRVVESRVIDDSKIRSRLGTAFAKGTAQGAPSIVEQSRALKHNPQLIYQFVHDQIEWEPGWGANRGALGTIIDGMGNAFDQSMLMIELLREAGFTANYVLGTIELSEEEFADWFGTTSIWASYNYCGNENIPANTPTWNGSGWDMVISHVWVECEIEATTYVFDPSRKSYTRTSPVSDLDEILEYSSATFISNAEDGATVDSEYVQNMNTANIHGDLTQMTTNLIAWIETNDPDATIDDILGGQTIVPATIPLLQTSLPYAASEDDTWTGDVPTNYKTTLRIRFPGNLTDWSIDETFTSDELAGTRLTLFFNGSLEPVLALNGVVIATGDAQGVGTWNSVLLTVTHNAYSVTWYDQEWWQSFIWAGRYYLIGNAWGNLGNGQMEFHQDQLAANEAAGGASTDEPVLGEKLAITFYSWAAQNSRICDLANKMTRCHTMYNHQVGMISLDAGDLLGTDLGGVSGSSTNLDNDVTKTPINDTVLAMHGVALEAAVLMQMTGSGTGASTTTVIDQANSDGHKVYKGSSSNWNTGTDVSNILEGNGYNSGDLDNIYNWFIQWGYDALISESPTQTIDDWQGWGYWAYPSAGAFGIINGGLKGGKKKGPPKPPTKPPKKPGKEKGDPIDIVSGTYVYRTSDLSVGSQDSPYRLSFERTYRSSNRFATGVLGLGWTHNHIGDVFINSDGMASMGETSAVHGAASIAELFVCIDLVSDTDRPVEKLTIMTLADKWWVDQVTYNTALITLGENVFSFLRQPDGSFTPPTYFPSTLTESSGEFTLTTPQGVQFIFNSDGQLVSNVFPFGVTITYSYTDGKLTSVSNNRSRELTLTYTDELLTGVSDGNGRTATFSFDEDSNLETVTDVMSENTVFEYDQPGRLFKLYRPANPVLALVTNVYDSIGRVESQTNGRNKTSQYYFAGSRAEEVDPEGNSNIWYLDRNGNITRNIDALNDATIFRFDGLGRMVEQQNPEGDKVQLSYDSNNNVLQRKWIAKPGSGQSDLSETFTYDTTWAKLETHEDRNGSVSTATYDESTGNRLTVVYPTIDSETPTETYTWNTYGQMLSYTDPSGVVTEWTYDTNTEKRLTSVLDPGTSPHLNLTTSYEYDTVGNTISIEDPNENTIQYEYNLNRQLTKITDPEPFEFETVYSYDEDGQLISKKRETGTTPAWQEYSVAYSATGKISTITDPSNNELTYEYSDNDNIATITDSESRTFELTWDELNRIKSIKDPSDTTYDTRTYTDNGLIATIEDAGGNITQFLYDGFDRPLKIIFPDETFIQYDDFDGNGNPLNTITRLGNEIAATYDALNRMRTKSPDGQPEITLTYDLAGRLTEISKPVVSGDPSSGAISVYYDTAGRMYKEEYPDGKSVTHELDGVGNRIKTTWPDNYYVTNEFDELNRLSAIKLNGSSTAAAQFAYDSLSRQTEITFGNGAAASYATELNGDLSEIEHVFAGSSVNLAYGYNTINDVTSVSVSDADFMWHPAAGGTTGYDTANELNQYPTVGGDSYSYNDDGCMTGNSIWTFTYDTENHLVAAAKSGVSASFVYDPLHRQSQKTVGSAKTRYLYAGFQRIADYDGTTGDLQTRYVYGNGMDACLVQISAGGTLTFLHGDKVGTIIGTSNNSGVCTNKHKIGPFGELGTLTTSHGFTGQRFDPELGLYYFKRRYYSPDIGRFLQPDSMLYSDDLNIYMYAGNSPFVKTDPMGLLAASPSGIGTVQSNPITTAMTSTIPRRKCDPGDTWTDTSAHTPCCPDDPFPPTFPECGPPTGVECVPPTKDNCGPPTGDGCKNKDKDKDKDKNKDKDKDKDNKKT